jgi:hypothetical protein
MRSFASSFLAASSLSFVTSRTATTYAILSSVTVASLSLPP